MKSLKSLFIIVVSLLLSPRLLAQADINHDHVQVGMQTGALVSSHESIPTIQFVFTAYSPQHYGLYISPGIGLEGSYGHQVTGLIYYTLDAGFLYTIAGRSAILAGYSWGGRYDGIQLRDPMNRGYTGWWYGAKWNSPDGILTPHGNISVMLRWFPATVRDRVPSGGWGDEYQRNYVGLAIGFNCGGH